MLKFTTNRWLNDIKITWHTHSINNSCHSLQGLYITFKTTFSDNLLYSNPEITEKTNQNSDFLWDLQQWKILAVCWSLFYCKQYKEHVTVIWQQRFTSLTLQQHHSIFANQNCHLHSQACTFASPFTIKGLWNSSDESDKFLSHLFLNLSSSSSSSLRAMSISRSSSKSSSATVDELSPPCFKRAPLNLGNRFSPIILAGKFIFGGAGVQYKREASWWIGSCPPGRLNPSSN